MAAPLSPAATRAQDPHLREQCSLQGLQSRLPLCWPCPADTPPSPKKAYRSHYTFLGWEELLDPASWEQLSDFDWLLRLIDFSGLRPVLAQRLGWTSAQGRRPYDPVSLFLLTGWQLTNGWSRAQLLRNLRQARYADYAQRFGFEPGLYPSEGGLRYFLTTLGRNSDAAGAIVTVEQQDQLIPVGIEALNQLVIQSVGLIRAAGLLSDQAWQTALICPDGQLHEAASRQRCSAVTDSCYQPLEAGQPRPCPAKQKGQQGCDCDTHHCHLHCRQATPRDAEARFVWHERSNQNEKDEHADQARQGEPHYGYCSLPLQLADPTRRFSITLLSDLLPANQREEVPAAALLLQLQAAYPDLVVDSVAGDAAYGYQSFLHTVYHHLGARRVVDLRRHSTDRDDLQWPTRGYDDRGRPICPYGYPFAANGFDAQHQRHKWICRQACLRGIEPRVQLPDVDYPPAACPFLDPQHPHGQVINIAERFPDGSIRLVRDIPVGTLAWRRLYHRGRNAVEARNAVLEAWGFKRLPVYGLARVKALLFQADVWANLCTLARLVREATLARHTT